jgi:hypothetical protein
VKQTKKVDWPALLLLTAILFGGLVRIMPALVTRFPLNDGGMFLDMTRDLQANHSLLPATTTYNRLDLPYAYPPLGFYVTSLLADVGRIPLLELFLWLPAFISILTIPAFYLLSRALLADNLRAALATLFFALTPGSYFWPVMGGGVTRAFGMLFLVLAIFAVLRVFQTGNWKWLSLAILFCSLAVLSHPEVAIQTAGACFVLWLFLGRTWRGALHAFLVILGVTLVTAPWWGTVIARHGLAPFLSASQTGLHSSASWLKFFAEGYTLIGFLPFLLILRLIGTWDALVKRKWLMLVLLVAPYVVDPRSAPAISFLIFNMLSSLALLDAIPEMAAKRWKLDAPAGLFLDTRLGAILLFVLIFLQFVDCGLNNYRLINTTLTITDRAAMAWVQQNLPPGKNFLLVTAAPYSMSDPAQEWFPTLTGQHSQTTLQGLEWTLGGKFNSRLNDLVALQACADIACVESWSTRTGLAYDYIWMTIPPEEKNPDKASQTNNLFNTFGSSGQFVLVYDDENSSAERIVIFKRIK